MKPEKQSPFSEKDKVQIRNHGLLEEQVMAQLELFLNPPAPIRLLRPCKVGDGIKRLDPSHAAELAQIHLREAAKGRCMKFVPASGSASRMFRGLLALRKDGVVSLKEVKERAREGDPSSMQAMEFLGQLERFPFYPQLKDSMARAGLDLKALLGQERIGELLEALLSPLQLGYEDLPKALVPFHSYGEEVRTSLEEHLVGAASYVADARGCCRIHFTVSPTHLERFQQALENARKRYEELLGVRFQIQVSVQDPSTDTLAVDMENRPFRDKEGRLLFRPGGHGALLRNLQDTGGEIVFIKNIDNVPHERFMEESLFWKRVLGGCLIRYQEEITHIVRTLASPCPEESFIRKAMEFAQSVLCLGLPSRKELGSRLEACARLRQWLDRPLRVCAMVENQAEPGGGPFWVKTVPGECALQIVESVEVDLSDEAQRSIWLSSTHFNPVDMVCMLRDSKGDPFDLRLFADTSRVLITKKSSGGRELKALEHPGLWNGGMARWNTIFVEVPVTTFQPVKTVNDLLRPGHQSRP